MGFDTYFTPLVWLCAIDGSGTVHEGYAWSRGSTYVFTGEYSSEYSGEAPTLGDPWSFYLKWSYVSSDNSGIATYAPEARDHFWTSKYAYRQGIIPASDVTVDSDGNFTKYADYPSATTEVGYVAFRLAKDVDECYMTKMYFL